MPVEQITLFVFVVLFSGYVIYRIKTLKSAQDKLSEATTIAKGHNARVDEAIRVTAEQTVATRENSELLRELIAVNRQLLDKPNQVNS